MRLVNKIENKKNHDQQPSIQIANEKTHYRADRKKELTVAFNNIGLRTHRLTFYTLTFDKSQVLREKENIKVWQIHRLSAYDITTYIYIQMLAMTNIARLRLIVMLYFEC